VIESSKEDYYLALRRTQATLLEPKPNWQPWLNYFVRALLEQKQKLETIMEREQALNAQLPPLARALLEIIEQRGRLSVAEAVVLTGANRNTIKTHLKRLAQNGQIRRRGAGRGSWYGPR
jgi:Fic family protein